MIKRIFILVIVLAFSSTVFSQDKEEVLYSEIPIKNRMKVEPLTESLCNAADKDQNRVENIFYWVSHYIKIDVENYNKSKVSKQRSPNEILKRKKGDAEDFAILFKAMCESVGIRCQIIQGYEKNDLYENGAGFYKPNHAWNAVLVNSKWEFVDCYNAAGEIVMDLNWLKKKLLKINKKKLYTSSKMKFKANYKPKYLFENPETARLNKIPVDPIWQLTDTIMPLNIFEKSEEDISFFNENYSEISKFKTQLSEINRLNENEQIIECADRTFSYNPRYTEMKAKKHLALANVEFDNIKNNDLEDKEKTDALQKGKKEIGNCKEYLLIEKSEIGKEYTELRKVNSEKRTDVIKYKQLFTTQNTKFISEAKTKLNASTKKIVTLNNEANSKAKNVNKISESKWDAIKTMNPEKKETTIEIVLLKDSIAKRKNRIEELTNKINKNKNDIEVLQNKQKQIVEELKYNIIKSDSSFMKEAIARSKKQDSFDDSVKAIRSDLYFYKSIMVDSLQKLYFANYDSTINKHETIKKLYSSVIDDAKDNVKDYESYKKYNSSNINLQGEYNESVQTIQDATRGFVNNNISEVYFIKNNKSLISSFKTIYEKENKYFTYLVNTEDDRKELVKKVLDKNEDLEKKRNEVNINSLKTIKEKSTKKKKK